MSTYSHLRINPERFRSDFESLARIGARPESGVHRPAFSDSHLNARAWFRQEIIQAGLELRVDGAGNHSALLPCKRPDAKTLLLGSHLDSVPDGGRFDGALGVLAALETLRVIKENGISLNVHLEAIDFTDEEGAYVGLLGSSALAGTLSEASLKNPRSGRQAFLHGLASAGLEKSGLRQARRDPSELAGYLELHIEQGSRLEKAGAEIGVVISIVGIAAARLVFLGQADHAGTTPMRDRRDASLGAAAFILKAHELVRERYQECVVNTGSLTMSPGAFNIVPAKAVLALEYRAPDLEMLSNLGNSLEKKARLAADRYRLELEIEHIETHLPAPMSEMVQEVITTAAGKLGLRSLPLYSGAGHDAQSLVGLCPTGMIFVPSVGGASHSNREQTFWQNCLHGANVLLHSSLKLAKRLESQ
jgi:beta-ureidopropionase / N-carbamoyl-L-amino-acid hydrolase